MALKWTLWVGLLAILTVGPALVASAQELPGSGGAAAPVGLGTPQPLGDEPVPASPAPFTPTPIDQSPGTRWSLRSTWAPAPLPPPEPIRLVQEKTGEQPKEPAPEPPAPTQPTAPATPPVSNFFGLPSVSGTTPTSTSAMTAGAPSIASTNVSGQSAVPAAGVGDLLASSNSAQGVEVQKRSPLVGDPRVDGLHFGQIVTNADGGYWFPARVDLDSVVSKLNPSDISNILVIRGPFSVRQGPGFAFIDIQSLPTPRSTTGAFDANGSSNFTYRSNGNGLQGQQSVWGGNTDWGFRLTYDVNVSGDYSSGNGTKLPSSFNNQFVNFAYGINLASNQTLEVRYMHVQQNEVLLPGLLTDINSLTTDGFTSRYTATKGTWFDRVTWDTWINNTTFNGDSSNAQTRAYIPALDNIFPAQLSANNAALDSVFNPVRLDITTNGNALSYGTRQITTWGDPSSFNISAGADARVFGSNYNEFNAFNLSVLPGTGFPINLGIPNARQIDVGGFLDGALPLGDSLVVKAGTRLDWVNSQFLNFGPNVNIASYDSTVGVPINRDFLLFSGYLTGDYKINQAWTASLGYGYAERPPTLTELYSGGAFLGLIQNGFNSIYGNPTLEPEQMHELNANVTAKYDRFRAGGNAFYAFVQDYVTYNNLGAFTVNNIAVPTNSPQAGLVPTTTLLTGTTPLNRLQFINTSLATMYGFNAYGEYDATRWLTPFATLGFVEAWDQSRDLPLPGIPPLNSRVGLRLHEPGTNPHWGLEYTARMVATQNLFASYLGEQRTGGFVVHYIRAYWQPRSNVQVLAGIENIGNLQYREHLDLRTGFGVFQPGINVYTGVRVSY